MNNKELKSLFVIVNAALFILVLTGFNINGNYIKSKKEQLCFKYAIKKCNFRSKEKAKLICNTLVRHNTSISGIKHHKDCRKDL